MTQHIDWLKHTHTFTSELGWQGQYYGSLKCSCGYCLPYETPAARNVYLMAAAERRLYGR
jgi:hypothetical protein